MNVREFISNSAFAILFNSSEDKLNKKIHKELSVKNSKQFILN